ncbi:MAG: hypothetical protein IJF87_05060 [Erysipelotrichaceae bacterium]|nr:hypothetical protein [Erysipelotrichaceae bacterium]
MTDALQLLSDLLFYFTIVSLFPFFRDSYFLMAAVVTIGFVSALIGSKIKALKPLSILLPLTEILLIENDSQWFFLLLIIGYQILVLITESYRIEHDRYRYVFGMQSLFVLTVLFVCITSSLKNYCPLVFGGLFLLTGIIVLRGKRLGRKADMQLRMLNAAEVIGVFASAALLFGLLYVLLTHSGKIFEIIALPFALVIKGLIGLFVILSRGIWTYFNYNDTSVEIENQSVDEIYENIFHPAEEAVVETDQSFNYLRLFERFLLILLAVAVIVMILYAIYRVLVRIETEESGDSLERGNGFEKVRRKTDRSNKMQNNNQEIRKIYREFLYLAKRKGIPVKKQTTSKEVLNEGMFSENQDAVSLRELYIRARYCKDYRVSDEDIRMAKECLARLRES